MAGLSRTMDLQRTDVAVAIGLKTRLIDYLHEARLRSNSSGSTELVIWSAGTFSAEAFMATPPSGRPSVARRIATAPP